MITTILVFLLGLLLLSIPVAAALAALGLLVGQIFSPFPLYRAMGEIAWTASTDFILFAIPLFVLLGEILLQAGIAARTYRALDLWLSWLPGGLMHANIGTSAMFAATSGSSVATAATITTVALPQARRYGYPEGLFAGSIAAGGTLGILIPPSINLIVYGFLTNTSIPQLFIAGIVPGLILALLFMICILIACSINPRLGGSRRSARWSDRIESLKDLLPVLFIFLVVIGSIYAGWATPTESAALGVIAALLLAFRYRAVSLGFFKRVFEGTMRTTAMIMLILIAANFLNFILDSIGLAETLRQFVNNLGLSPFKTLLVIIALYLVLGLFVETLSLMVITVPIVTPVITGAGYDPVWFGVLLILLIEMALITPPVGLNLYVVQGVRRSGSISDVMIGAFPFVLMILVMIGVLVAFPGLALHFARTVG
ncbi:TRAP transporter, DctM subunit [Desulfacinum infernum DSM 9756]|jgi:tripartite ATP-independent transporter DctM subunit|uniref:TRAP transporter, DctM subunit n=1 Tax=Desulfacinum infernum DSM 9756 TaxID=1121391 RepID=A0A1M4T9J4_9BACT|nr:TRAP transporter large permease [Desulfacinum infernum]MBC7360482.1 TRAP transporter large permease [Desulfacinum sp.]MBZ4658748.1 rane protein [Desulfacinum sp.]SHE40917.1 TRAP transporter, DctM subunit [Desulfacinum infernum DSM 9756]